MANIGIIGAGFIAEKHALALGRVAGLRLVAASRRDPDQLQAFGQRFSCRGYADYTELLRHPGLDAVLIATPHHVHVPVVEAAAALGKHILLEKPIAPDLEGCLRIERAITVSGVCFMAGHSTRFTRAYGKAQELVSKGTLGRLLYGQTWMNKVWLEPNRRDWHLDRKTGGGMWLTIGIHLLDRLLFLINQQVTAVSAVSGTAFHEQSADDYTTAFLRFGDGASGYVSCAGYDRGAPLEETILVGTEGSLSIRLGEGVRIGTENRWEQVPDSASEDPTGDSFQAQWCAFHSLLTGGADRRAVGLTQAVSLMEILFAVEQSSAEQREILLA